jgi:uncharacterized protein YtpQ (UPF0354 family)
MAFAARGAVPLITFVLVVLSSMNLDSGANAAERGVPKSAPAFTKFVGRSIQDAMPAAKVTVIGRLRLDVEAPKGGHTTDLHNVYSTCQRNPETCGEEVSTFVAQMVELYKAGDVVLTRDALRIIVRPSAFVAAARANAKRNRPLAAPLVGDFWMMAAIDQPTTIGIMDENDLSALKLSGKDAAKVAFANTERELGKPLADLAKGSTRGMLSGDPYASSALLFLPLWAKAAHSCKDNLLVAVPAPDVVLYADGTKPGALQSIVHDADEVMAHDDKPFSDSVFRWSPHGWILVQESSRQYH